VSCRLGPFPSSRSRCSALQSGAGRQPMNPWSLRLLGGVARGCRAPTPTERRSTALNRAAPARVRIDELVRCTSGGSSPVKTRSSRRERAPAVRRVGSCTEDQRAGHGAHVPLRRELCEMWARCTGTTPCEWLRARCEIRDRTSTSCRRFLGIFRAFFEACFRLPFGARSTSR